MGILGRTLAVASAVLLVLVAALVVWKESRPAPEPPPPEFKPKTRRALRPARGVTVVRVRDEADRDVERAEVTLVPWGARPFGAPREWTGLDGEAMFKVPPGAHLLVVESAGHLRHFERVELPQEDPLVVDLSRGAALDGRVVDEAGQPVAGVPVLLNERLAHLPEQRTVSDDDGAFTFPGGLRDGVWRVSAAVAAGADREGQPDAGPGEPPPLLAGSTTVVLRAGGAGPVEVVVRPPGVVTGKVVDERGRPLPGIGLDLQEGRAWAQGASKAKVSAPTIAAARGFMSWGSPPKAKAVSDRRGAFTLPGVFGGPYVLKVLDPGLSVDPSKPVEVHGGDEGVVVRVVKQPVVSGRALDENGRPLAGVLVGRKQPDRLDARGHFSQAVEFLGEVEVEVSAPGRASVSRWLKLAPGRGYQLGDVRLPPGRSLTIDAKDARTGARVRSWWRVAGGAPLGVEAQANDAPLVVNGVPPGDVELEGTTGEHRPLRVRVGVDQPRVDAALDRGLLVAGRLQGLVAATGKWVRIDGCPEAEAASVEWGERFFLPARTPGRCKVTVEDQETGAVLAEKVVDIPDGGLDDLVIDVDESNR